MFDALSDKLNDVFRRLGSKGRLTEKDVDEALREVRLALLEADVNFKVAPGSGGPDQGAGPGRRAAQEP